MGYEGCVDISDRSPVDSVEELLVSSPLDPGLWERETKKRQEEGGRKKGERWEVERTG